MKLTKVKSAAAGGKYSKAATSISRRGRSVGLAERVIALIEGARQRVAAVANIAQVYTNYEIGRQIVEEEQGGKRRADYGKQILIDLSQKLTARFGRGWSAENLRKMRTFFLMYSEIHNSVVEIDHEEIHNGVVEIQDDRKYATALRKSGREDSLNTVERILQTRFGNSVNTVYEIAAIEDSAKNRIFVKQYMSVMPSKVALKRIVIEEKRRFERERLLAIASMKAGAKST